jgi:LCP family protein required for cell wall assembly
MSSNPSPALAAFLSFIFPGLGQIYAGDIRRGLIWTIPMLVFIVAVLFLLLGGSAAITSLLTAQKTLALIIFDIAFFLYHVAAMIDAYDIARNERTLSYSRRSAGTAPIVLAGLIALAMLVHGLPAMYAADYYNFVSNVTNPGGGNVIPSFTPSTPRPPTPTPSLTPTPSDEPIESPGPGETPDATPSGGSGSPRTPAARVCPPAPDLSAWPMASDGRVNLLLVGSDSRSDDGVAAASLRTDSMMLMSIDIASCKAALFSFPRNMEQPGPNSRYPSWFRIPLENGTDYPGFLFGLWRDAASSPGQYPGSDGIGPECQTQFDCERGWRALTGAIQNMSGVPVDAVVAVNLKGFVDIVANLPEGGVWIDVPSPLYDEAYFNSRQERMLIDFKRGCQFMNPEETLAYARSRHQDSDYERGRRQQYVIQQIRKQLDPLALLPHVPGLLNAAQANLFMSISDTDIPYLAQVASRIDADRMYRYDFAPARLTRLGSMDGMRDKIVNIFTEPEPEPTARPNAEPCPPR